MNLTQKVVPSIYARSVIAFLVERGVTKKRLLANTGLDWEQLQDPGFLITHEQQLEIYSNAAVLSPVLDLGLRIGGRIQLCHHGIYGFAMQTCASIDQALRIMAKYIRMTGAFHNLSLDVTQDEYRLKVTNKLPLAGLHRLMVEECISSIMSILRELRGKPVRFKRLSYDYPEPDYISSYKERFLCPLTFSAEHTEMVLDRRIGNTPIDSCSPEAEALCVQRCDEVLSSLSREGSIADRVREVLMQLPCNQRTSKQVSSRLEVSARHLRRRLVVEGVSFQGILDDVRLELAKDYLVNTELTIEEVSPLIGFTETNNFRRAFKRWTGVSPSIFRKQISIYVGSNSVLLN